MTTADAHATIDAIWRIEAPKIIGGLTRLVRDLATAEDLAHDALVAALEQWPADGVPVKPGAWLMATAKHRAIDTFRRAETRRRKTAELGREVLEWVRKAPFREGEVEVRQVASAEDFGDALTPELREQEDRLRATVAEQHGD